MGQVTTAFVRLGSKWSGGDYTLAGGFWGATRAGYRIYLPVLMQG